MPKPKKQKFSTLDSFCLIASHIVMVSRYISGKDRICH